MYEKYLTYKYTLKIDGQTIGETDERRLNIQSIQQNVRRSGLSSLTILFSDPDLRWRNFFTVPRPIKIEFTGMNYDGSAPQSFEGYVSQISPMTSKNIYDIEIVCLNAPPSLTNSQKIPRVFKKMSRSQVITKIASENKVKVHTYATSEYNAVEDEITLTVNTSYVDFMVQILEEIGYRFTLLNLKEWVVTPIFSPNKNPIGGTFTNLNGDTTLLDFEPTFSRYSYEEDENDSKSSKNEKSNIDPNTKKTNDTTNSDKPNTNPQSKGGSGSDNQMYYNPKNGQWRKA